MKYGKTWKNYENQFLLSAICARVEFKLSLTINIVIPHTNLCFEANSPLLIVLGQRTFHFLDGILPGALLWDTNNGGSESSLEEMKISSHPLLRVLFSNLVRNAVQSHEFERKDK